MNILRLDENDTLIISQAAKTIRDGGIVLAPFDTVYGFVCDPRNDVALGLIFGLKNRNEEKTVGVAVSNLAAMKESAKSKDWKFIESRIPGSYTFILNAKSDGLSHYCYKNRTIAIRVPDNKLILDIIGESGEIIAQTSANKSGLPSCNSIDKIKEQFSSDELDSIDLIIDSGKIDNSRPSELWDLTGEAPKKIER